MNRLSFKEWKFFIRNAFFIMIVIGLDVNTRKLCQNQEFNANGDESFLPPPGPRINHTNATDKGSLPPTQEFFMNQKSVDEKKPFLVIHVGPPKTGSTTLQVAFQQLKNNGLFGKDKYYYNRKDFFEETVMNHACHLKLQEIRASNLKDNQYTISEKDLAHELRSLPCWNNTLMKIEPFLKNRTNLFASYEGWSFRHLITTTERGASLVDWESIRLTLMPDWNVFLIFAYRRYPEWIFSSFHQKNKPTPQKPGFYKWPGMGGEKISLAENNPTPLHPLPRNRSDMVRFQYRYSDELKREMERNPEIPYAIFNMHSKGGMISNFVCNFLPNARQSCKYVQEKERAKAWEESFNPSHSLFYDALAVAAYEKGLFNGSDHERSSVAKAVQEHHHVYLNNTLADFPLICPPKHRYFRFLNLSLSLEEEIVPEFAKLPGVGKEHRASFWKQANSKKFCWIDTEAALKNTTWIEFFKTLKS